AHTVGQQMWDTDFPADRRNIDHSAIMTLSHRRENGESGAQRSPEVDVQRLPVVIDIHRVHRTDIDGSGIVNQHIDLAQLLADLVKSTLDLLALGHVTGDGYDPVDPAFQVGSGT